MTAVGPLDPGSVQIRPVRPEDHEAICALVSEVLAEHGLEAHTGGVTQDLREAEARYSGGGAGFWVAEAGGVVLGTVAIRPREGDTCELKRLYLRPECRGSGLGQRLYEHAEAFARGAGYGRIWLDSSRRFARARRLYERNGFVLREELDNAWQDSVYDKRLEAP